MMDSKNWVEMAVAQIPDNERERLEALREYVILDTLPESDFDGITKLASVICEVPVALITFVDEYREIFKSHHGTEIQQIRREESFYDHGLHTQEILVVEDARSDDRFYENPQVNGGIGIVFYAGFPLVNQNGHVLGTLCVIDRQPRTLNENQLDSLNVLAHQVMQLLELRRKNAQLEASTNAYSSLFKQNPDGVFSFDLNGRFLSANEAMLEMVENTEEELKRTTFARYVAPQYIDLVTTNFREAVNGYGQNYDVEIISSNGKKRMVNITSIPNVSHGEIIGVYGIAKDITQQKKSQLKLEKSELGLKQAQELSHIGNWELDFVRQRSFWSDEMYRILGFEPGEIKPTLDNYLAAVHKDDFERVSQLYDLEHTNQEDSQKSTHKIVCKNNEIKIVYSESRFIVENGITVGMYGILRDVTEKQKSIEQFKNSEQKTRLIMNSALDAIMWIDSKAKITFWNLQAEKTFGWMKDEVMGKDLVKLIASEETQHLYYNAIRDYIEKGEESTLNVLIEQEAINKAGEAFPIELTMIPIRQDDEISFCVFIRNISERRRFGNELRLSEKRYRNLFYLSPLPMWVYDLETLEFLDVNDAAVRHYGYSYEEFRSMTLDEIRPEDELGTFEKALNFVKKSVVFHRGDFQHKKKNGDIIDVDVQSNMIEYNGKEARLILATDITRERNNERELKKLTHSLEQKVRERTIELNEANQLLSYEHQQTRDSIMYAKNIQSSILHREYDILQMFNDSFVLFRPKDKVSGDFFWCHETEDYYLVAVLDCTGHGVPGAMISMVGFQLLNQIVIINGETSPAEVLTQLDKEVNNLFHQSHETSSVDGMDMIYCRISKHTNELHYAGAQRPLFLYSEETLTELKGTKLSIGGSIALSRDKKFEAQKISFQPGDSIYLTTDGYYSQFGGPRNKVMLKKRMKEELARIAHYPAVYQLKKLQEYFTEWQGNEEQVDDVLVIGVKL